jgi:cell fate regulator YaaT (PSP1 superfamily)
MVTDTCKKSVEEKKLALQIIGVRHSFDRKVVTITYTAEERVEFQEFVSVLANELHARIEMKQIGVRDAAGIVGGMGPCGRCLCCSSWLKDFEAVSVRMAKNQRLSLSPNTISGVCGRLKCCLHYENECYSCMSKDLPREGTMVTCPEGRGRVVDQNILAQKVKVRLDDNRVREFDASEVV